jgi:hypothetical protein
MSATTASNLMIARRANIKARADFATWLMMEKLRSVSSLTAEAQDFLARYHKLRAESADEAAASEAIIREVYAHYYAGMGGTGTPPEIETTKVASGKSGSAGGADHRRGESTADAPALGGVGGDNVTPFRKVKPAKSPDKAPRWGFGGSAGSASAGGAGNRSGKLPVALIFLGLVVLAVAFKYLTR